MQSPHHMERSAPRAHRASDCFGQVRSSIVQFQSMDSRIVVLQIRQPAHEKCNFPTVKLFVVAMDVWSTEEHSGRKAAHDVVVGKYVRLSVAARGGGVGRPRDELHAARLDADVLQRHPGIDDTETTRAAIVKLGGRVCLILQSWRSVASRHIVTAHTLDHAMRNCVWRSFSTHLVPRCGSPNAGRFANRVREHILCASTDELFGARERVGFVERVPAHRSRKRFCFWEGSSSTASMRVARTVKLAHRLGDRALVAVSAGQLRRRRALLSRTRDQHRVLPALRRGHRTRAAASRSHHRL
eukprot:SAG31_NODE_4978_length_2823_cov_1.544420_3_plen_299_part_00